VFRVMVRNCGATAWAMGVGAVRLERARGPQPARGGGARGQTAGPTPDSLIGFVALPLERPAPSGSRGPSAIAMIDSH
jgi:hypothetical protein